MLSAVCELVPYPLFIIPFFELLFERLNYFGIGSIAIDIIDVSTFLLQVSYFINHVSEVSPVVGISINDLYLSINQLSCTDGELTTSKPRING
jgi:hypothetical protein